jgi:hypothetical protein
MQNISGSIGLTENIGRLLGILFVCRSYCYGGYGGCLHKCPTLASVGWAGLITILIQRRVPLAAAPAKGSA